MFFELIQVALGTRDCLSQKPSEAKWQELYDLCQKQSVVGVVFPVLEELSNHGQKPPLNILCEWIGLAEHIKQQNRIVNRNAEDICKELEKDGYDTCILKGQSNNLFYPTPFSRTPGDIDVYVSPKSQKPQKELVKDVIRCVKEKNLMGNACYHHIDYGLFQGTEVEVHFRPSFMFNPLHNHRLQKWFVTHQKEQFNHQVVLPEGSRYVNIPTQEFNVIFQLSHVYNHLLHEGIGLRQVLDYYFLLCSVESEKLRMRNYLVTLRYLGLEKIAGAMMWILNEKLGLPEEIMITKKDEKRGKVLLAEIMRGGNFGRYDDENIKAKSRFKKNVQRIKRDLRMMRYFPSECLWEPCFRVYHLFWRKRYN